MKYLETYRCADIYEDETEKMPPSEGRVVNLKVVAKGRLPSKGKLQVDFMAEGIIREEALKQVKDEIDQYLSDHGLTTFIKTDH